MTQNEIKETVTYMNPSTGSVDTGAGWIGDFLSAQNEDSSLTWEAWGGGLLVEVRKNAIGEWVEAQ